MTVKGAIADADKLALAAESYGELANGRVYNPLFATRDGSEDRQTESDS